MTEIHDQREGDCFICEKSIKNRVVFRNMIDGCPTFINLPNLECAHMECYIDICVGLYLEERRHKK